MISLDPLLRRSVPALVVVIALVVLLPISSADATNIQDNVGKGADIIMKELRWPAWDKGTYYCQWYSYFYPERHCTFYGGVATHGPDHNPGIFTTYWAPTKEIHVGEGFSGKGYGAEGSKGGAGGQLPTMRPGAWFKFVMRVFPRIEGMENEALVGYWIKDVERNEWHVHSVLGVGTPATGFVGNSGFVEALAPNVRRVFERRLGYYRLNGKWHPSYMSTKGPQHVRLIENDTALRFDTDYTKGRNQADPFIVKQPNHPPIDRLNIERCEAHTWNNQVIVKWKLPKSSPPQIACKVEAFADPGARGEPLVVEADYAPHMNVKRLDAGQAVGAVRLSVTDLFDQKNSVVIPVQPIQPLAAKSSGGLRSGLAYDYYETPEATSWNKLPKFSELEPVRQGAVNGLDVSVQKGGERAYALRFAGYLRVPKSGLYAFSLKSLDGSRLIIDGEVIGDNDGLHSRSEKMYPAALSAGTHEFEMLHFRGHSGIALRQLEVFWEGPGIQRRMLTDRDFLRKAPAEAPSIRLASAKRAAGPDDNLVTLEPQIDERGREINRVEYFCGALLLSTISEKPFALWSVLPEGENIVMARLWYDENNSVDSNRLTVRSKNVIGSWEFKPEGEAGLALGVRCQGDQMSFMGEGSCGMEQTVTGDFTFTARIADVSRSEETGTHKWNWIGLYMTSPEVKIFRTAGLGMRGMKDYPDLCGTGMAIPRYPEGQWVRLVRRGKVNQSFVSVDGRTWTKTFEQIGDIAKEARVGVNFKVIPRGGQGLFHAALDNVRLEKGRVPGESRARPSGEDLNLNNRITALVQASDRPETFYARSTTEGLLTSTDRGERWQQVNTGLGSAEAMAVRSVAVHPRNSSVILRGGGNLVGELKVGTCADSEFGTLGLGKPASPVKAPGRIYGCGKRGTSPKVLLELEHFGVTRFDSFYFATTRGVYMWGDRFTRFRQPLYGIPGEVFLTAIGSGAGGACAAPFSGKPSRVYLAGHRNLWTILADVQEREKLTAALDYGGAQETTTMWNGYQCRQAGADEFLAFGLAAGGISCVKPDSEEKDALYLCNRDGILKSTDRGQTYKLVYKSPVGR